MIDGKYLSYKCDSCCRNGSGDTLCDMCVNYDNYIPSYRQYITTGRSGGKDYLMKMREELFTKNLLNAQYGSKAFVVKGEMPVLPEIKDVIFNGPATIVIWTDGTKTIVKSQEGEVYDAEKGLAMAIVKKAYGNKGNYFNNIKKWVPEPEPEPLKPISDLELAAEKFKNGLERMGKEIKEVSKSIGSYPKEIRNETK